MLRTLIVDDEHQICALMNNLIDWENLPMESAGFASNGLEAIEILQKEAIDIVITDVRMPGMDGLELLEKCKELGLNIKFVIMSGYTQFEYAYSAIRHGVEDFLLKPLDKDELNDTLRRITQKLLRPGESLILDRRNAFLASLINQSFPIDCQKLSVDFCNQNYNCTMKDALFLYGLLQMDYKDAGQNTLTNVEIRIKNLFSTTLSTVCQDSIIDFHNNQIHFFLNFSMSEKDRLLELIEKVFDQVLALISPYHFVNATLITSKICQDLPALCDSLAETSYIKDARILLGINQWISGSSFSYDPCVKVENVIPAVPAELPNLLELLKFEEAKSAIIRTWISAESGFASCPHLYSKALAQYLFQVLGCIKTCFNNFIDIDTYIVSVNDAFSHCFSTEAIRQALDTYFSTLFASIQTHLGSDGQQIINSVQNYILAHIDSQITLEDVSQIVYLNPSYLGSLFKQKAGVNFGSFLTDLRITEAKKLLKNSSEPIVSVANRVGYKDQKHFRSTFKKIVGVKPSEYRKIAKTYPDTLERIISPNATDANHKNGQR